MSGTTRLLALILPLASLLFAQHFEVASVRVSPARWNQPNSTWTQSFRPVPANSRFPKCCKRAAPDGSGSNYIFKGKVVGPQLSMGALADILSRPPDDITAKDGIGDDPGDSAQCRILFVAEARGAGSRPAWNTAAADGTGQDLASGPARVQFVPSVLTRS
jgi:hypothetical protein